MKFAVIGGDMRQAKLAELLAADGHSVSTFAIDKIRLEGSVAQKTLIREAVDDAGCVIMPLPVTSREGMLNAPLSSGLHTTREVLSVLRADQVLCAGRIDCTTEELAGSMGITLIDYLDREELAVANAVAAAEGAIQLIMEETPITVCHSRILVIGFRAHRQAAVPSPARPRRNRDGHGAQLRRPGVGSRRTATRRRKRRKSTHPWVSMMSSSTRFRHVFWGENRLSRVRPRVPVSGSGLETGRDGFLGRVKARGESRLGAEPPGRGRARQLRRHHPGYDL